jgi:hypothetical protein
MVCVGHTRAKKRLPTRFVGVEKKGARGNRIFFLFRRIWKTDDMPRGRRGNRGQKGGKGQKGQTRHQKGGQGGQTARFSARERLEVEIDQTSEEDCGRLARYRERAERLNQELRYFNRERRDDSILAYRFCMEPELLDPMWRDERVVAHELACIQTIHDATPYDAVCQATLRRMAGVLNRAGIQWGDAWHRCRTFGVPLIKLASMMACEDDIPEMAPSPPSSPSSPPSPSPACCY